MGFREEGELDEGLGEFRAIGTFEDGDGVCAEGGSGFGCDPDDAGFAIGGHEFLGVGAAVEVDAHAGGGVSLADVVGDFGGAIGEVAGVGGHALDELESGGPTGLEGFRGLGACGGDGPLDLVLDEEFEGACDGAAFGGVGEGEGAGVARVAEVVPCGGRVDFQAVEGLRVVADAELGHAGADPDAISGVVAFAGEGFRDDAIFAEPFGVFFEDIEGDEAAFFCLACEVGLAAAEEEVDADAIAAGFLSSFESGVEDHADFRGAAGGAPVDVDGFAGFLFPVEGEGLAEFLADGFVVRGEDDEAFIGFGGGDGRGFAAHQQWQGDDERQQSEDGPCTGFQGCGEVLDVRI